MTDVSAYEQDMMLLDDLIQNHGFPTFEQFVKNPELLRRSREEIFESIQDGSTAYKLGKIRYFWRGVWEAKSLEKLQQIAKEDGGFSGDELEMEPIATERISLDPRKTYDVDVNVWPKGEMRARGGIVANE